MMACLEEPNTPTPPTRKGKGTAYAARSKIPISTGHLSNLAVELVYEYRKVKRPGLLVKSLFLY